MDPTSYLPHGYEGRGQDVVVRAVLLVYSPVDVMAVPVLVGDAQGHLCWGRAE